MEGFEGVADDVNVLDAELDGGFGEVAGFGGMSADDGIGADEEDEVGDGGLGHVGSKV